MILITILTITVLLLALLPTLMFTKNLQLYRPASKSEATLAAAQREAISVLIPARNEAAGIATTLEHLLKSDHTDFEILILDDHSEDNTAEIVKAFADRDYRVRLLKSKPLPDGWNGNSTPVGNWLNSPSIAGYSSWMLMCTLPPTRFPASWHKCWSALSVC